ncbi:DNA cytosine methyltransferase [Thalassospira sp. NFXS8]|uniref:DNA cytosine methyltransferase n=1 Tax=Thalassospira sp. NFXS8 TaxID=2819093 RepID=UPI0032DEDB81
MPGSPKKKPTVVDLFAGAGGFSLAAILEGFELKFAIENNAHAVSTFQSNILKRPGAKGAKIFDESILKYSPSTLRMERFGTETCDLLLGGPPCQGFSTHRILDAGVNDPRNELIHAYFKFVEALQPRVFLMENVPGILWKRHEAYLKKFYEEGSRIKYVLLDPVVLDARDFGVPQRRKRVFVLGIRQDVDASALVWPPKPTHCDPRKPVEGLEYWKSCETVFRATYAGDLNDVHMISGSELVKYFKRTPPNGGSRKDSGRVLPCHKDHDGHKDVYGRINSFEPAPTMTTACINPSKGRFVHPTEHHGITVRQAARIQTFPDDFVFKGGLTAAGAQVGNAVPIELGRALICHLKKSLINVSEPPLSLRERPCREIAELELA